MELNLENIYSYLESNKNDLNFIQRDDVVIDGFGVCRFKTLFQDGCRQDMPKELITFLQGLFNITEKEYDFLQIQKYEIGDYILPHKDPYANFGLVMLSTSQLDGLVVEDRDKVYRFHPDVTGHFVDVPRYSWHWVNPVREKTRYTAVFGLEALNNLETILDQ
jgi:hypothetical protein